MGFSRQEYWSGLLCSPPGDLPGPGIELVSSALQVDSLLLSHKETPWPASVAMATQSLAVGTVWASGGSLSVSVGGRGR